MAWCYVKKKKTMFSVHFYVLIGRFLGVKTLEKNPTGQQVTGLSSLARTECIPVAPLTQWHVVLLLEVGLCGFCQLPYKSVHTSLPPDWNPDKWFNLRRTGLAFSSPPPPDHIPGRYEAPGFLHALGRKTGKRKNYAWKRSGVLDRLSDCFVWDSADHSSTATCTTINVEVLV